MLIDTAKETSSSDASVLLLELLVDFADRTKRNWVSDEKKAAMDKLERDVRHWAPWEGSEGVRQRAPTSRSETQGAKRRN